MENQIGQTSLSILVQFIPHLQKYFQNLPEAPNLSKLDDFTRLQEAISCLITYISNYQNNAVIIFFIDDLQWADENSVSILNHLFQLESNRIFFLFAVRGNEISGNLSVKGLIRMMSKENPLRKIKLQPLGENHISEIISDMTDASIDQIYKLATIVNDKTRGNPFFVIQVSFSILFSS